METNEYKFNLQIEDIEINTRQKVKSSFSRQNNLQKAVLSILKKQSLIQLLESKSIHERSQKDCRAILEYLKNEPYFEGISKNYKSLLEISSWIQYKRVQAGEYVYKINQISECFYVMLEGLVHLSYPEKEAQTLEQDKKQQEDNVNSAKNISESAIYPTLIPNLSKNLSYNPKKNTEQTPKAHKRFVRHLSLIQNESFILTTPITKTPKNNASLVFQDRIIRIVGKGECFGDLGDIYKRGTNAVAKQTTYLLVIRKQHYDAISHAQLKSQNKIKYEFLSSLPLFKLLFRYSLESIIYLLQQVKIGYNSIVYSEEESIKYIYIIYKGQFKFYKKVKSKKQEHISQSQIQEMRKPLRNISFRMIEIGQILGYTESYKKIGNYQESCVCKCQEGVMLRIEKTKFLKKILSTDNNLEQIEKFIENKIRIKMIQLSQFLERQVNDATFVRYLHPPSAHSRRIKTQSSIEREQSHKKQTLRKLSVAHNNFFNQFNKTINKQLRTSRISVKKCANLSQTKKERFIPSRIRDIVQIVDQQTNYFKIRKPKQKVTLFEFNISKVPLHVKKKFEAIFKSNQVK